MDTSDLNDAYEIDSKIPGGETIMANYAALSAQVARGADAALDVSYGSDPRQRLDVFASAGGNCPAILFFHGGYWTGGGKESRRFPAPAWNDRGVAWVPIEYRLAPAVMLDDIVRDARRAVAWFHGNAKVYGCDPDAIHVCGNSAGGHLAGMLAATDWQSELSLPHDVVKSATAISGLFDLTPLRQTFVNDWLDLDDDAIQRNSPIGLPPRPGLPVTVAYGGQESEAFHQQSLAYARMCEDKGGAVVCIERAMANHFTIIGELGEPESPLFLAMAGVVGAR